MSQKQGTVSIDLSQSDEDETFDMARVKEVKEDCPLQFIVQDCRNRLLEAIENIRKQFVPLDNLFWFLEHERIHILKSRFVDELS